MKKFSDFKRINEAEKQEETTVVPNLPENIKVEEPVKQITVDLFTTTQTQQPQQVEQTQQTQKPQQVGHDVTDEKNEENKEVETTDDKGTKSVSSLFSKLFESREMAHIYHLKVNGEEGSHAKHIALGNYYENVLEFIDDLIETYQGQYGLVDEYDVIDTKDSKTLDTLDYFTSLSSFIKENRNCISSEDSHLHNIIDEVAALVYRTIYKLKYTK